MQGLILIVVCQENDQTFESERETETIRSLNFTWVALCIND